MFVSERALLTECEEMQSLIVRPSDLRAVVGIDRTAAYRKINPNSKFYDPSFPLPVKLGPRAVGWKLSDLLAWVEAREPARGGAK